MDIVKLGSLYLDGIPGKGTVDIDHQIIEIGDTRSGKEISWVQVNGLLIADHTICTHISWEQLNELGFIWGKPIKIDGINYLCRSLKVGTDIDAPNEWDAILDATGEDDSLWNWNGIFFWGQEIPRRNIYSRAIRGYNSARNWDSYSASYRNIPVGFRPILEPLGPDNLISDSLIGRSIKVYGQGGTINGILSGLSDYDLFLSPVPDTVPMPDCKWYCRQEDGTIIVAKSAVVITKET